LNKFSIKKGLAFKLVIYIFSSVAITFAALFVYNYLVSKDIIEKNIRESSKNLTNSTVNKIERVLAISQTIPENFSKIFENSNPSLNEIDSLLKLMVQNNDEIYGATFAFEPYSVKNDKEFYAPYFYKDNGKINFKYLGGENYNYFDMEWYKSPKDSGKGIWSEPYFDEGGGSAVMTTFSVPIYKNINNKKEFVGVLTADLSLDWLSELLSSIKVNKS